MALKDLIGRSKTGFTDFEDVPEYDYDDYDSKTVLTIITPSCYCEEFTAEISKNLTSAKGVILNMSTITSEDRNRYLDYISGILSALRGEAHCITDSVCIVLPSASSVKLTAVENSEGASDKK